MRRWLMIAVLLSWIAVPAWVVAGSEGRSTGKKSSEKASVEVSGDGAAGGAMAVTVASSEAGKPGEVKVQVFSVGKGIKVENGKVEVQPLGAAGVGNLPPEVQKLVKELNQAQAGVITANAAHPNAAQPNAVPAPNQPAAKANAIVQGEIRVIVVGPDGKRSESVMKLGDGQATVLGGAGITLTPLLESKGVKLPEEARKALEAAERARKQAAEATERARKQIAEATVTIEQRSGEIKAGTVPAGAGVVVSSGSGAKTRGDIHAKLDKILERLDSLEKEVKAIKTQERKQ